MKPAARYEQHGCFTVLGQIKNGEYLYTESQISSLMPRDSFDALVADAKIEAHRAMQEFPQPNYVITKIAEESGEVVKAAVHFAEGRDSASHVRKEMVQALAMMYRLWMEGDEVHGCKAISRG